MSHGFFRHKKSKRLARVWYDYSWSSDTFYAEYLGREFTNKGGDEPFIGRNWQFLGDENDSELKVVREEYEKQCQSK